MVSEPGPIVLVRSAFTPLPVGRSTRVFYEVGLRYGPRSRWPHRIFASVTKQQVHANAAVTVQVERRFEPGIYYLLAMEAFL